LKLRIRKTTAPPPFEEVTHILLFALIQLLHKAE